MKEIIHIRELIGNYLMQDSRYRDTVSLTLYRFYESAMPYQIALRMSGSFDQHQFNQRQSISGEIWLDVMVSNSEGEGLRIEDDEALTELCEYLSWFSHVENGQYSLTIRPLKSSSVKNANTQQALLSYAFSLIRQPQKP